MAASVDIFKSMFPEFCSVDDNTVELWLNEANDYLDANAWGDCFDRACLYYTAHELSIAMERKNNAQAGGAGGGIVQSASAGGLNVTYAVPNFATQGSIDEVAYARTPYGTKYLQLRDSCLGAGRLAGTVQNTAEQQVFD